MSTTYLHHNSGDTIGIAHDRGPLNSSSRPARPVSKPSLVSNHTVGTPEAPRHGSKKHLGLQTDSSLSLHPSSPASFSQPVVDTPAKGSFSQPTPPSSASKPGAHQHGRLQSASPATSPYHSTDGILFNSRIASRSAVDVPSSSSSSTITLARASSKDDSQVVSMRNVRYDDCRFEVGLENLGNTCFMNSTLQCLLHIEPLIAYFLEGCMDKDLNPNSPKKGVLAKSFNALIVDLVRGKTGSAVAPVNFQRAVAAFAPYLMDYQQQDSQEFLRFLLDGMSDDLCRRKSTFPSRNAPADKWQLAEVNSPMTNAKTISPGAASSTSPAAAAPLVAAQRTAVSSLLPALPQLAVSSAQQKQSEAEHVSESPRQDQHLLSLAMDGLSPTKGVSQQPPEESTDCQASNQDGELREASDDRELEARARHSRSQATDLQLNLKAITMSSQSQDSSGQSISQLPPQPHGSKLRVIQDIAKARELEEHRQVPPGSGHAPQTPKTSRGSSMASTLSNTLRRIRGQNVERESASDERERLQEQEHGSNDNGSDRLACSLFPSIDYVDTVRKEAAAAWESYLKLNDSIITDIFGGLLQSTIQCSSCHHRSFAFDPFLDLSVPISRDGENSSRGLFPTLSLRQGDNKSTLEKCLEKFTAEEMLEGDDMYHCEKCKKNRKCVKKLSIFRYPRVLVVHIKRFRFSSTSREKLSTDVHFPVSGLDLSPYLSADLTLLKDSRRIALASAPHGQSHNRSNNQDHDHGATNRSAPIPISPSHSSQVQPAVDPLGTEAVNTKIMSGIVHDHCDPVYDLIGVSNHHGSLNGGHYIAHVDTNYGRKSEKSPRWVCFNDARVSNANLSSIAGPTAYVLFYRLREDSAYSYESV